MSGKGPQNGTPLAKEMAGVEQLHFEQPMNRNIERVNNAPDGSRNVKPLSPSNPVHWAGRPGNVNNCRSALFPNLKINVVFITHTSTKFPVKVKMISASSSVIEENHNVKQLKDLKPVEFSLQMPTAKSVQLAADFTDWEAAPIDMIRFGDGIWCTTVPLPPGTYAYCFLVDGNWHHDPKAMSHRHGAANRAGAVVKID